MYYINHVQLVYISDIPPAGGRTFIGNLPSGLWPLGKIPINLLCSRWYITYLLAMLYGILHTVLKYAEVDEVYITMLTSSDHVM